MIFIFEKKQDGTVFEDNQPNTRMEFKATDLPEIVSNFEDFLRGCSFFIDGHFEIVEDDV
jgi:hypothetical protein